MGKSPQSCGRWWQDGAAREVEKLVSEGRLHGLNTEDESEVTKCAGHGIEPEMECQLSLLSLCLIQILGPQSFLLHWAFENLSRYKIMAFWHFWLKYTP